MAKNHIITGLDIGTSAIKALAVSRNPETGELEFLGKSKYPSFGIRRGVAVKPEEISKRIVKVLYQLQEETGRKTEDVYINIGGSHLFVTPSQGSVVVSRADQKISEEDKHRVIQAAQAFPIPSNREILEIFPREFVVDNQGQIKDPVDMQGVRLEVNILALCAFSPFLKNLTSSVLKAGFHISDITPSILASSRAVLTPQQKELGVCLLDIGAGTTDMAVYEEGDLVHAAVFPVGSERITNDLAVCLKTDVDLAEQIKKEFGRCVLNGGNKKEKVKISKEAGSGEIAFTHKILVKIIEARVREIFKLVSKELKKAPLQGQLTSGVVLTGGGAGLPKMTELAKKELKLPARLGKVKGLAGFEEDFSWSTAAGIVLAIADDGQGGGGIPAVPAKLSGKMKKIFKIFIP